MKKHQFLLPAFLFIAFISHAQVTFQKTFKAPNTGAQAKCIRQTTDGGYILTGTTGYNPLSRIFLVKLNYTGDTVWTKYFGDSHSDMADCVIQTSDGGYIIAGSSMPGSAGNYNQFYLIKTDSNGDTLWTKQTSYAQHHFLSRYIQQTTDGGYIIAGVMGFTSGQQKIYLVKTDGSGNMQWTSITGGSQAAECFSIQQTTDGGYIVGGYTYLSGAGNTDIYLLKMDSSGNLQWAKTYGGPNDDYGYCARQTSDGGYILTGVWGNAYRAYLLKTDSIGQVTWAKQYGTAYINEYDYGYCVRQTTDGGYIITGGVASDSITGSNIYLVKTNSIGDTLWTKSFGDTGYDAGNGIEQTTDGGYIIGGIKDALTLNKVAYIIKTDSLGNSGCNQLNSNTLVNNAGTTVAIPSWPVSTGGTMVNAFANLNSGGIFTSLCSSTGMEEEINNYQFSFYPNPASDKIIVTLTVEKQASYELRLLDITGKVIATIKSVVHPGKNYCTLDIDELAKGVYILELKSSLLNKRSKIILE